MFHLTRKLLAPGDLIEPGNWGRVLRNIGPSHISWNREAVLENIRARDFPNKPTRFQAAFAFATEQGARWWRSHERHGAILYAVEPVDHAAASHLGDMLGVQQVAEVDATPQDAARRYWSRGRPVMLTPDQVSILEFLSSGPLRVLAKLD